LKLHAVSKLSLDLQPGETLGLVGESGSGKSTLARAIIGTVPVSSGDILYQGKSPAADKWAGLRRSGRIRRYRSHAGNDKSIW
jgi:oligopeptide transport system ATP-binding protein